jgi:hypothetical protein
MSAIIGNTANIKDNNSMLELEENKSIKICCGFKCTKQIIST